MMTAKRILAPLALAAAAWAGPPAVPGAAPAAHGPPAPTMYVRGQGVPRDVEEVGKELRAAAEGGDAKAQYRLATRYLHLFERTRFGAARPPRRGAAPDYAAEALAWYRRAAAQGYAPAQYKIGRIYDRAVGVPRDKAEAIRWYRRAAEGGYVPAQYLLGIIYSTREAFTEAMTWYRRAAERGDLKSQYALGTLYYAGRGGTVDYVRAYKWLAIAADRGHRSAVQLVKQLAGRLTPAQLAEARRLVSAWKAKKAAQ